MSLAKKNDDADWLSRWGDPTVPLPDKFQKDFRVVVLTGFGFSGPTCAFFHRKLSLSGSLLELRLEWTLALPTLDFCQLFPALQTVGLGIVKLTCKIGRGRLSQGLK